MMITRVYLTTTTQSTTNLHPAWVKFDHNALQGPVRALPKRGAAHNSEKVCRFRRSLKTAEWKQKGTNDTKRPLKQRSLGRSTFSTPSSVSHKREATEAVPSTSSTASEACRLQCAAAPLVAFAQPEPTQALFGQRRPKRT